jgi:hypothetical protein
MPAEPTDHHQVVKRVLESGVVSGPAGRSALDVVNEPGADRARLASGGRFAYDFGLALYALGLGDNLLEHGHDVV